MKKIVSLVLTLALVLGMAIPAMAVDAGEQRVAVGADLTTDQKATVYDYFKIDQGSVEEVTVTNADERSYLESVDSSKIGTRALSSVYIITKAEGAGLDITLYNINWLTEEIYRNALITAGITDGKVIIAAPVAVSGTAALTGIYKAYEDITGTLLDEDAKQVATEELVTTGDLADDIGSEDAAVLVNEIKRSMDAFDDMTDAEVRTEIYNIAINLNISLTDDQVEQLLQLVRSFQTIDLDNLTGALNSVAKALGVSGSESSSSGGFWSSVTGFFSKIGSAISGFFSGLFG